MARARKRWSSVGAAAGGVGGAGLSVAAAACCTPVLAPLVVSIFGVSGAIWAAGLKPYSGLIVAVSGALIALGFWLVYRPRPAGVCEARRPRGVRLVLWLAAGLWLLALAFNVLQFLAVRFA